MRNEKSRCTAMYDRVGMLGRHERVINIEKDHYSGRTKEGRRVINLNEIR